MKHQHASIFLVTLFLAILVGCGNNGNPPATKPDASPTQEDKKPSQEEPNAPKPHKEASSKPSDAEPLPGSKAVADAGPPAPTIFFLDGLKGYTEPCGCTLDVMLGGIDRITGFMHEARGLAKGSLLLDGGNTLFDMEQLESYRVPQERAKVKVIVEGMVEMGVASTTPGPNDFALGKLFYLDAIRNAGLEILVANMKEEPNLPMGVPHAVHELEGTKVGVIGLVQPDLFTGVEGIKISDPIAAAKTSVQALKAKKVDVIVAVFHADLKHTKELLEKVPDIQFALAGHKPRKTDQVDPAGNGFTLESYDQGRYVGILKLYPHKDHVGPWSNARNSSQGDLERIDRRIEQVQAQIERMPPSPPGQEPPFLKRLRDQLQGLKNERQDAAVAKIEIPAGKSSFVYRTIPMEPGYKLNDKITKAREAYNEELSKIIQTNPEPIPPVAEGEAEYVGVEKCATCHVAQNEFWKTTRHSHAIDTLIKRNKSFDNSCVGCHVTGYRKPGGSVAGKLQYTTNVGGQGFTKKLENVGCEVCHGPGSLHIQAPMGTGGKPQHIQRAVPETVCKNCHNEEHSARFKYDVYLPQILGKGHGQ